MRGKCGGGCVRPSLRLTCPRERGRDGHRRLGSGWIGEEKRNCASGVRKAQGCGWNHGSGKTGEDVSTPRGRGLHGLRILRGAEGAYSDVAMDGSYGAGTVSGGFFWCGESCVGVRLVSSVQEARKFGQCSGAQGMFRVPLRLGWVAARLVRPC